MGLFDLFKKKTQLTQEQLKWNKMWDLWVEKEAISPYAELMTYQSDVNNGGHDLYFTIVEDSEMANLEKILPEHLKDNLQKAYKAYLWLKENDDEKAEEILEQCDDMFYENEKEINSILEEYASKMEL